MFGALAPGVHLTKAAGDPKGLANLICLNIESYVTIRLSGFSASALVRRSNLLYM